MLKRAFDLDIESHVNQRYWLAAIALVGTVSLIVLCLFLPGWIAPSSAEGLGGIETRIAVQVSDSDLSGRVEELSRSQDRLVTALIAAVGAIGTVLILIVGLSSFQANRNAERETELIRGIAMNKIAEAVATTKEQVDMIVGDARTELRKSNADSLKSSGENLAARLSAASQRLKQIADGEIDRVDATVKSIREGSNDFATAAIGYFDWFGSTQLKAAKDISDENMTTATGLALINLSMVGTEIVNLQQANDRGRLSVVNLKLLERGLELVNANYAVPEQNRMWYAQNNRSMRLVKQIAQKISNDLAGLPDTTTSHRQRITSMIANLLPAQEAQLPPDQLARLVASRPVNERGEAPLVDEDTEAEY